MVLARVLFSGICALGLACSLAAQQQSAPLQHQYEGQLGESRTGMTIIRRGNPIEGGHYFYQKFLKDIPRTGSFDGSQITLNEMGAGVFHLHFVGNDRSGDRPLDFGNSIGMEGLRVRARSDSARSLPVSLRGTGIWQGAEGEGRYSTVTSESGTAFEQRVQSFYRAALGGDKASAARFIHYPLDVSFATGAQKTFRNSAQILASSNDIFTPSLLKKFQQDLPHDMPMHEGEAMLGNGEAWFDAGGLVTLSVP